MTQLRVMGPIEGWRDGRKVDLGGPTQRRLLASLAARPDEVVSVSSILGDLWGEDPPPSGPASIQSYVSRLRRSLGPESIETTSPGYKLGGDVEVDWVTFLDIASSLPVDPTDRLEAIETALKLWRGPPFEDFDHVDFAVRRLHETRFDIEEEKARLLAAAGEATSAIAVLEKITNAEPLRESAWTTLALVLARAGRQADAVRSLDRYRDKLAQIGLEPGPGFSTAESEVFETRQPLHPQRAPLARADTSFVGRSDELSELRRLIGENRLVTIVGPGGMGKTRLGVELAADWEGTDVVVARLESIRDDREVAPTVLSALGGETRGEATDSVLAHLARSDHMLLVLDNVEHVIDTTAALVSRILGATRTRMLVTSREPLNTPQETVFSLGPLDPSSSIELFRDRARRVLPDFEAAASTLDMLCEELDYMPLAIEMAAARSKALAADEILSRLHRRYGLFTKPLRGGADRHRSLDALVDWSYGLLDDSDQRAFERLSVVVGTIDVEIATAVAAFGDISPDQVAASLANLVEKSLINRTGPGSFRMLRILKSFAGEMLATGPDEDEARARHARWFAGLAEQIGKGLSTPEESLWIERANSAVDDLGEALRWATRTGDLDVAQAILEGLFDWFYHRQPPAITGWGDMVRRFAHGHDAASVANAWSALAAMKEGDIDIARDLAERGTPVASAAGRFAWFMTGEVACYEDRLDDALDAYRKQLVRASTLEDRIGVIDAMAGETLALAFRGDFKRAVDIAGNLEKMAADIGAPTYRAYADYALAEAIVESEPERAADLLEGAVDLASSVNNHYIQAMARTTLGSVLARLGRLDEATHTLHAAMELWESLGLPAFRWTVVQYLGAVLAERGENEMAGTLLAAAQNAGRRPLGAGQSHWVDVTRRLELEDDWDVWKASGIVMTLDEASAAALAATRPRR